MLYYAIIHIPREEHLGLLKSFHCMLKLGGFALLSMGSTDAAEDLAEYHGTPIHWSHYDDGTNQKMVKEAGFGIVWSKLVDNPVGPGEGEGLFVLAQKR